MAPKDRAFTSVHGIISHWCTTWIDNQEGWTGNTAYLCNCILHGFLFLYYHGREIREGGHPHSLYWHVACYLPTCANRIISYIQGHARFPVVQQGMVLQNHKENKGKNQKDE